jgi:hypothetical protein
MVNTLENALEKVVSKVFTYDRSVGAIRAIQKATQKLGLYEFDIYHIPDKPHVLAHNHGFKLYGSVADLYVLGPGAPRPVHGLFYHKLFKNPLYRPFLKSWNGIPTNRLKEIEKYLDNGDIIALAPSGPEHMPSKRGEVGAAWIARKLQIPLIPTKITQGKGYVRIDPGKEINVSADASRDDLREITDEVMHELGYNLGE